MNTDELRLGTDQVTERIIGCALKVSNGLGIGFPEKVYGNALAVELRRAGLVVAQQRELKVHYEGVLVG
jgi:GxxExxY protein